MVLPDVIESMGNAPARFGDYLLEKRIAVGGMSEVYLARSVNGAPHARPLVIKRMIAGMVDDQSSRSAFAIEARLHTAVRHPNVVEVFEAGEVDGDPYLAMEYVAGLDAFQLMRKSQADREPFPPGVAIYMAREVCKALACIHRLRDEEGRSLGIVHRDVTPSNIYLSEDGDVKLGDFGIARSALRNARPTASHVLKGKYAYLAPEQVAGEPFDHRADLFSLVVVLTELLIGKPLFAGAGQLAVLLAIRDCRLDALHASSHLLPDGLMPILERGLAQMPGQRIASADELYAALAEFERPTRAELRKELADRVRRAKESASSTKPIEDMLDATTPAPKSSKVASVTPPRQDEVPSSTVRTQSGRILDGVSMPQLLGMIAAGELTRNDEVDIAGAGFRPIIELESLARHLPSTPDSTARFPGPGIADYAALLSATPMLEVLAWLLQRRETGALFVTHDSSDEGRRELYFRAGQLMHVVSTEPRELLGEYLVRRGALERTELEMALLAMPQHGGRLDDTLLALGLVDPAQLLRAVRRQARDRVSAIFGWEDGRVSFYRGVSESRIAFPLELDIPQLMLAGLESAFPGETLVEHYRDLLDRPFAPVRPPPDYAKSVTWPAPVLHILGALGAGRVLGEAFDELYAKRGMSPGDALRALLVGTSGGIIGEAY